MILCCVVLCVVCCVLCWVLGVGCWVLRLVCCILRASVRRRRLPANQRPHAHFLKTHQNRGPGLGAIKFGIYAKNAAEFLGQN